MSKLIRLVTYFVVINLALPSAEAQQFKWVKGGGTAEDLSLSGPYSTSNSEAVYYMCTDANRNIYALTIVGHDNITADTFFETAPFESHNNMLLTSYNCSGQMRWAKLISASNEALPNGIAADKLGHIYVAGGLLHANGLHGVQIGGDTTITGDLYKRNALIQLDTSGNFNWIRFIGDNSTSTLIGTLQCTLVMDGINNAHLINFTKPGVPLMPGVISEYGTYDLMYNSAGALLSATKLELDSSYTILNAVIDTVTNKLFAVGDQNMAIGLYTSFAASFDASRNKIWLDTLRDEYSYLTSVADDNKGHLYFNGGGTPDFRFRNDSVVNTHYPTYFNISVIMKTDTAGNPIWITKLDGNAVDNYTYNSLTITGQHIAAAGTFFGELINGADSIVTTASEAQNPFLEILDTAGNFVSLWQIHGDGFYDGSYPITSDSYGNIFIGGKVEDSITADGIPAYQTHGGNSDFFVMKYGYDCACGTVAASFTVSRASGSFSFIFTGTTTLLDSVVWNFGDGTIDTGIRPTHVYAAPGTYNVCATVFTDCGSTSYCDTIAATTGITTIAFAALKVYPSPVGNTLFIENAGKGTVARIYDIAGRLLSTHILNDNNGQLATDDLVPGNYILQLTNLNGYRISINVLKTSQD